METPAKQQMQYNEMDIERQGNKIILPTRMSYIEAIKWLERKMEEDERKIAVNHLFKAFPLDGAAALQRAIARKYGWAQMKPTPGFFGDNPPQMVGVKTGVNTELHVPWGRFAVPDIDGWLGSLIGRGEKNLPMYRLFGEVKQKDRYKVQELAALVAEELQLRSVYRGKAIRFAFPQNEDDPEQFDPEICPDFLDVTKVHESELIFSEDIAQLVDTALFNPVLYTEALRRDGVPLKRGILLEGPYGVGKTLLAYVTAKKAQEQKWTFLYTEVHRLAQAIEFALLYQPCVIFAEDLDQVLEGPARDQRVNDILNTIDGVQVKGQEVMVVLTTNHVEKINKAMLRPGRLDTVISIAPPDAEAAEKLVRLYGRGLIPAGENLGRVGALLNGRIPAVIREVVERAKLAAIGRSKGAPVKDLSSQDLVISAEGMVRHLGLLTPDAVDSRSDIEKAAGVLVAGLKEITQPDIDEESLEALMNEAHRTIEDQRKAG